MPQQFQFLTVLPTFTTSRTVAQTDESAFAANMAALFNLAPAYLKVVSIVSLAYQLNSKGGTNYISPANQTALLRDAANLFGTMPFFDNQQNQQLLLARTVCDWNAGYSQTSTLSRDPNVLLAVFPGLLEMPLPTLDQCILMLRVKLAV